MLIDEAAAVVYFIVQNHVQILLGRVLGNFGDCEFLGHCGGRCSMRG